MDKEEKAVTANDFFLEKEKQAKVGEIIVKVIVIISYACLFAEFIPSIVIGAFNVWGYIISIIWAVCYYGLYLGKVWAKWVYIISSTIVIFLLAILFFRIAGLGGMVVFLSVAPIWVSVATAVVQIASCILLIRSQSVREFICN